MDAELRFTSVAEGLPVRTEDLSHLLQYVADVRASRDTYRELLHVALTRLHEAERRHAEVERRYAALLDEYRRYRADADSTRRGRVA